MMKSVSIIRWQDVAEVRDESDRDGVRIAIEPAKRCEHGIQFSTTFPNTLTLQINYNFNMVAIDNFTLVRLGLLILSSASPTVEVILARSL